MIGFTKMDGAGNDFVVMDNRDGRYRFSAAEIARLCDRHRGIGADGLLLVEPPERNATARMRYYNSDGGEAEMCGNGARCFARYLNRLLEPPRDEVSFETLAGVIQATFPDDGNVCIHLSDPLGLSLNETLTLDDGTPVRFHSVNTGVPHAVLIAEDPLEDIDVLSLGTAVRRHARFAPAGTNVNFVNVLGPGRLRLRTYERGVEAETLACGTGMAACALVHHALTGAPSPIELKVAGGDTLWVGFLETDTGNYEHVTLAGPAVFVFEGTLSDSP